MLRQILTSFIGKGKYKLMSLYRLKSKNLMRTKAALFFILVALLLAVTACSATLAPDLVMVAEPLAAAELSPSAIGQDGEEYERR